LTLPNAVFAETTAVIGGDMMERSDRSGHPRAGGLERLLQWICGHPRDFAVYHQVVNWLVFFAVFLYGFSGLENTLLGLSPTWVLFLGSAVLAACYYLTRVRRVFERLFGVVALALWLVVCTLAWFANNGIAGSTPIFLIVIVTYLTVYQGQRARWLAIGLLVGQIAILTGIQVAYPELISPYPSPLVGTVDMAYSITMVLLYLIGYIAILTYNLEQRRRQADDLLLNILPRPIAEQLKFAPNQIIAQRVPEASVLFADAVNFTPMSADMSANELVELLDEVFSQFDALVEQRGLEKIKTIGDCYMVAAGVPEPRGDHAAVLADLALAMQAYVCGRSFKGRNLAFRIGIHSGPVVAGVIGRKKFIYDLWGDTVNTASRMESHGVNGCIQVTEATHNLIQNEYACQLRGSIPVKGKGEMPVWFVVDRKYPQEARAEDGAA
jgi:class 3 adenylate cyclase